MQQIFCHCAYYLTNLTSSIFASVSSKDFDTLFSNTSMVEIGKC